MANPTIARTQAASVPQAFFQSAERHRERIALRSAGEEGTAYSYADLQHAVRSLAAGLNKTYPSVARIGILSENRPEWAIAYLAALASGKTVVPLDANLKTPEHLALIKQADLSVLFCSSRFAAELGPLLSHVRIHSFEPSGQNFWRSLMVEATGESHRPPADTAALIFTSGTTGQPRAVRLTHANLLANLEGVSGSLPITSDDVFLSLLPLHHTYEATCGFLYPLMHGATIAYARSLKSRDILDDIRAHCVTVMCGVPLMYEKMHDTMRRRIAEAPLPRRVLFQSFYALSGLGHRLGIKAGQKFFRPLRQRAGMATVRLFVSGGAAIPPHVAKFFSLVGFEFMQGYGMTECSPVISTNQPWNVQFGSVGPPLGNIEVRIHEPDQRGVGEIIVRGESVTPGYLDDPAKTAELLRNGWLHTGDLGYFQRGHLWICGRIKNVIISAAGKNIYPEELESLLVESPYVAEAVVFGQPRPGKQGEEVRAILVPQLDLLPPALQSSPPDRESVTALLTEVVKAVNDRSADYKRIVGFEVQFEELEKTSTRKVKRFVYRHRA